MRLHKDAKMEPLKGAALRGCSKAEFLRGSRRCGTSSTSPTGRRSSGRASAVGSSSSWSTAPCASRARASKDPRPRRRGLHRGDRAGLGRAAHGHRHRDIARAAARRHGPRLPRPDRADAVDRDEGAPVARRAPPRRRCAARLRRVDAPRQAGFGSRRIPRLIPPSAGHILKAAAFRVRLRRRNCLRSQPASPARALPWRWKPSQIDHFHMPARGNTTRAR